MDAEKDSYGPGYYDMVMMAVKVKGPAKVFYSNSSFESNRAEGKTIGEIMMKSEHNVRFSSQRRSTITGEAKGALNRSLFTKD